LQKLEHALHPVSAFVILPIFALSNAGVYIKGNIFDMLLHPISLGIIGGLVLGKFVGITLFSKVFVKLKLGTLPPGVSWHQVYGMSFLAGIGFTMSMFISELGFEDEAFKEIAKVGVLAASLLAAILGVSLLRYAKEPKE
jgi:NhaA family Na+:H+ antiporter